MIESSRAAGAEFTHLIIFNKSQDSEELYRAEDGMLIGARQGDTVRFGMEPKEAAIRMFLNAELAGKWLRKLAGMEVYTRHGKRLTLADVVDDGKVAETNIEERDGEKLIALPAGTPRANYRN